MNYANVRVRQGGDGAGLLLKPLQVSLVLSQMCGKELERNSALQPGVLGEVDFAHPACAERRDDLVVINRLSR